MLRRAAFRGRAATTRSNAPSMVAVGRLEDVRPGAERSSPVPGRAQQGAPRAALDGDVTRAPTTTCRSGSEPCGTPGRLAGATDARPLLDAALDGPGRVVAVGVRALRDSGVWTCTRLPRRRVPASGVALSRCGLRRARAQIGAVFRLLELAASLGLADREQLEGPALMPSRARESPRARAAAQERNRDAGTSSSLRERRSPPARVLVRPGTPTLACAFATKHLAYAVAGGQGGPSWRRSNRFAPMALMSA